MKVLLLNGNGFIGSQVAKLLLDGGHQVDVFHRGKLVQSEKAGLRHLQGDRDADISILENGSWDCTVDFGALYPGRIARLAELGIDRWGHFVLISSTEVYSPPTRYGFSEADPLREMDHGSGINGGAYGFNKVLCEVGSEVFPEKTIVRPTYVIGRTDPTFRFNRWVARICEGGEIAIPQPSNLSFQAVDVRDVAEFVLGIVTDKVGGTFQLTAPFPPISFREALDVMCEFAPRECIFIELPVSELERLGITEIEMPLWPGWSKDHSEEAGDPNQAVSVGFRPRPFRDTASWLVGGYFEGKTIVLPERP
jgi:2'-hydroxyisoflavone reductase